MTNAHKVKSKTGTITQKMKKISKYLSWSKKNTYAKTINVYLQKIWLPENFNNDHL